jgi:putative ATP-binding cassette transporter
MNNRENGAEANNIFHHHTMWRLIKAYWVSENRLQVYLTTFFILLMTITLVGFDVVFNYWYNYFYNALQAYKVRDTVNLLIIFFVLAGFRVALMVYQYYVTQRFAWRWRRWLTKQFLAFWLKERAYYYLENFDDKLDNPDQRIQEDIGALVSSTLELTIGLIGAVTTFLGFIYILWTLSGTLSIPLGSLGTLHIPGYLVWVGVIYSFIGTLLTFKIGRPLIGLTFQQQRLEANFRFTAIDLRSHAVDVALYHAEDYQKTKLSGVFNKVLNNWYAIILRQRLLLWFTGGYGQLSVVLPLVVALPNYFNKVFLLGGLMQTLRAFSSVQDSLSFIVNAYPQIAQWRATAKRLTTFSNHIDEVLENATNENHLAIEYKLPNQIVAKDVSIYTPRHQILLKSVNQEFIHGQHYLIKGQSGLGKSTFVRALAGIWPFAVGKVYFPEDKKIMYLPQQPYMPIGTLAEAILFPAHMHSDLKSDIVKVLEECHLAHLIPRLSEKGAWGDKLSPGEQQRVTFARVILSKPDWVFLDESTSMLDLANEHYMYELLKKKLPDCSMISVGHRPTLDAFHDHIINMESYRA